MRMPKTFTMHIHTTSNQETTKAEILQKRISIDFSNLKFSMKTHRLWQKLSSYDIQKKMFAYDML